MGNLKEYSAYTSYTGASASISHPQVSYVDDKNKVFFTHSNYMVVTYNVTSTTESIRVLGEDFNLSQVSTMLVDGKKIDSPFKEYTFNITGIHKVRVIFKPSFTDATDILYNTPCFVDKYIDKVNLDAITVNKEDLINGGGAINYFIATYNVTSTTYTQLLGTTFDKTQIQKMYIDNVKDWQIVKEYTFNTTGIHTVMFVMKNNFNSCKDMFTACNELISLDVSNFDTSNVVNMNSMFNGCHELTSLDVSNFNTSNVTDMENMFADCRSLTSLDLSDFDTSKVTNMWQMFSYCSELTSVTMINSVSAVTNVSNMFSNITTTGIFYYNGKYDYSKIIARLPSTWIAVDLNAEWVDLGLPSGLKWADRNVGASKPEECGLYFAWGETQGYTVPTDEKQFKWDDYKFTTDGGSTFTKYNDVDGLTTLEASDDAANKRDRTSRMPTADEMKELIANTTSAWTQVNGVSGCRFTSNVNGNTIFIPAAGFCGGGQVKYVGSMGELWTSSLFSTSGNGVSDLYFAPNAMTVDGSNRYYGFPVRAVQE